MMMRFSHSALHNVDVLIENPHDPVSEWTFKGKPFEVHIVKTAREKGIDITDIQHNNALRSLFLLVRRISFLYQDRKSHFVVVGAPDILLARAHMDKDDIFTIRDMDY
jgi:hypothetical protein